MYSRSTTCCLDKECEEHQDPKLAVHEAGGGRHGFTAGETFSQILCTVTEEGVKTGLEKKSTAGVSREERK